MIHNVFVVPPVTTGEFHLHVCNRTLGHEHLYHLDEATQGLWIIRATDLVVYQ